MLYSPKEAAEQLGVSKATIYRRIKDGSIPSYKLSRSMIRIDEKCLEDFKEKQMQNQQNT